jgi:polysaccharide export outer membrane protein
MLKTPRDFKFDTLTDKLSNLDYKIAIGDVLNISVSPNDGFNKINLIAENNNQAVKDHITCVVDQQGKLKLPLIGLLKVNGKTPRELETELESLFQNYYVKPFVTVTSSSKRFVIIQGVGTSRVIKIDDDNFTLYEALASAQGIVNDGKAYNIKLIRNIEGKNYIFKFDLSAIEGAQIGQTRVLPNDVIYVEPRLRLVSRALSEATAFLSILSTTLLVFNLVRQ